MKRKEIAIWVIMVALVAVIVALMTLATPGCGPSPYPICTGAQSGAQRCDGATNDSYVSMCDGVHWLPALSCGEIADAEGRVLNEVCVETERGPECQAK